ncbi:MAG: hypothetical protein PVI90_10255, partial [Desulfobacteraceae bacterium]
MPIDYKAFFHAGTVRICSSLDIDTMLSDCFRFLKDYIPLEMIELSVFDRKINSVRILARHADFKVNHDINTPIKVPPEAIAFAQSQKSKIFIFDSSIPNHPAQKLATILGISDVVGIVLMLSIKDEKLGVVKVLSRGKQKFTKEHA